MDISKGAIIDGVIWVSQAILKLQKKVIMWPDYEEQKKIGSRIEQANGFVNYVGLIDGTLFPLALNLFRDIGKVDKASLWTGSASEIVCRIKVERTFGSLLEELCWPSHIQQL